MRRKEVSNEREKVTAGTMLPPTDFPEFEIRMVLTLQVCCQEID